MKVAFFTICAVFIIFRRGLMFAIMGGFKKLSESDKRGFYKYNIKNNVFRLETKHIDE